MTFKGNHTHAFFKGPSYQRLQKSLGADNPMKAKVRFEYRAQGEARVLGEFVTDAVITLISRGSRKGLFIIRGTMLRTKVGENDRTFTGNYDPYTRSGYFSFD